MNKKIFILLLLCVLGLSVSADRAMPGLWRTLHLNDGTEVLAELKGDEYAHYWQSAVGEVFVERGN